MNDDVRMTRPRPRRMTFLITLALVLGYGIAFRALAANADPALSAPVGWSLSFIGALLTVVLPCWIWHRQGELSVTLGIGKMRALGEVLWAVPSVVIVLLSVAVLRASLAVATGNDLEQSAGLDAVVGAGGSNLPILAVLVCIVGPIGEEVFCRKFLFVELRAWCGTAAAFVIQAVIFAALHRYEGAEIFASYFLIGLLLQGIYLWRRTLLSPILVHGMLNLLVMAVALHMASLPKPYLGISFDLDSERCKIERVAEESAAMEAGLLAGDVIVSFDSQPIDDNADLSESIRDCQPGERVWIEVVRNGEVLKIEAVLGSSKDRKLPSDVIHTPDD